MIVNAYERQNALCEGHHIWFVAVLLFQFFCSPLLSFSFFVLPPHSSSLSVLVHVGNFCLQLMQSNQNPLKLPMDSTWGRVLHVPFLAKHREVEIISCSRYSQDAFLRKYLYMSSTGPSSFSVVLLDILSTSNNLIFEDAAYANIISTKHLNKHYLGVWEQFLWELYF